MLGIRQVDRAFLFLDVPHRDTSRVLVYSVFRGEYALRSEISWCLAVQMIVHHVHWSHNSMVIDKGFTHRFWLSEVGCSRTSCQRKEDYLGNDSGLGIRLAEPAALVERDLARAQPRSHQRPSTPRSTHVLWRTHPRKKPVKPIKIAFAMRKAWLSHLSPTRFG